MILTEITCYQP